MMVVTALGWFSYRCESWFVDICAAIAAFVAAGAFHLARPAMMAWGASAGTRTSMGGLSDIVGSGTDAAATEALPVWTRIVLMLPGWGLQFALGAFFLFVAARLFCHVRARCYTDPIPAPTREQLRARLWTEMQYSDDLLDR